jgi:hypothetical protein
MLDRLGERPVGQNRLVSRNDPKQLMEEASKHPDQIASKSVIFPPGSCLRGRPGRTLLLQQVVRKHDILEIIVDGGKGQDKGTECRRVILVGNESARVKSLNGDEPRAIAFICVHNSSST